MIEPPPEIDKTQGWLHLRQYIPFEGMQAFAKQVKQYTQSHFHFTADHNDMRRLDLMHSAALHDAVLLYAHAATKVLVEGRNVHQNDQAVAAAVRNITVMGAGGHVALDDRGDRIVSFEVANYVLHAEKGFKTHAVGLYNSSTGQFTMCGEPVVWPGGGSTAPLDKVSGAL